MQLQFEISTEQDSTMTVEVNHLVIAGWAGRDKDAVMHHIRELEALGVPAPGAVPLFYRVAAQQLTQDGVLEVVGEQTSGEAEPFIFFTQGEWWVSLASDHTDRQLETVSVALSKQVCIKPVAAMAWRMSEVLEHWDSLQLSSQIKEQGEWVNYQQGTLAALLPPGDLIERYSAIKEAGEGLAISCGTLAALGGIRPANEFRMELYDPVLKRTISHQYTTECLPVVA
ncbi:DUF2848 domain-containing protein [Tatumella saanichensis]|uniref:DUF2848 domain-containing protein n=1 Tax=Tatumella saanichensis TaxID=480813 RepID=UPI0004A4A6A0|nr:DUF2848 domain-containing protein [Tatumella saanichensis]